MSAADVRELSYAESLRETLADLLEADPDVFLMGEDIGVYGGAFGVTTGLLERFGRRRIRDTPISEIALVGAGVGAALSGLRPIVELQFSDFVTCAMDQLVNQAAKIHFMLGGAARVPLVVRAPAGSGTGAAAQHSQSLEAWFAHVPGLKVVMPATPADVKGLLHAAVADPNPVIFLEHKLLYRERGPVPRHHLVPLGTAAVLQPVDGGQQAPRVLRAAEQVGRFLEGLVLRQGDDHHRFVPGPGDHHFLAVVNDRVQGLGIVRAGLRVRQGLHRAASFASTTGDVQEIVRLWPPAGNHPPAIPAPGDQAAACSRAPPLIRSFARRVERFVPARRAGCVISVLGVSFGSADGTMRTLSIPEFLLVRG